MAGNNNFERLAELFLGDTIPTQQDLQNAGILQFNSNSERLLYAVGIKVQNLSSVKLNGLTTNTFADFLQAVEENNFNGFAIVLADETDETTPTNLYIAINGIIILIQSNVKTLNT